MTNILLIISELENIHEKIGIVETKLIHDTEGIEKEEITMTKGFRFFQVKGVKEYYNQYNTILQNQEELRSHIEQIYNYLPQLEEWLQKLSSNPNLNELKEALNTDFNRIFKDLYSKWNKIKAVINNTEVSDLNFIEGVSNLNSNLEVYKKILNLVSNFNSGNTDVINLYKQFVNDKLNKNLNDPNFFEHKNKNKAYDVHKQYEGLYNICQMLQNDILNNITSKTENLNNFFNALFNNSSISDMYLSGTPIGIIFKSAKVCDSKLFDGIKNENKLISLINWLNGNNTQIFKVGDVCEYTNDKGTQTVTIIEIQNNGYTIVKSEKENVFAIKSDRLKLKNS